MSDMAIYRQLTAKYKFPNRQSDSKVRQYC
jgi:hypothetical protein